MSAAGGARHRLLIAAMGTLLCACAPQAAVVRPAEQPSPVAATPPPPAPPPPAVEPGRREPAQPAPMPSQPLTEPPGTPASVPEAEPVILQPPLAPAEPTDEQQLASLLADLQRYGTLGPDDIRREQNNVTQILGRQRTDYNRVRLAVLYTLAKNPQDDQRAMQLFDTVLKSNPGSPAVKQLAAVLQAQVAERQRAVKDEQQKADAAIKKLEALRTMERDLLRDRIRGGGGGGGGGGSSGGGGGGGGGGG